MNTGNDTTPGQSTPVTHSQIEAALPARDLVIVQGADAAEYLQSQLSQDLDPMGDGDQRWTLVLDPTGKIDGFARVSRESSRRFVLDTDVGFGESLAERLRRFLIRRNVTVDVEAADPVDDEPDREAARIALGWPRLGRELIVGETIPAGTGLAQLAVSFTKGCYPGQELVERMDSRGATAPSVLCHVPASASNVVGDPVGDPDGNEIGYFTSVASPAGLGWVARSAVQQVDSVRPVHLQMEATS